MINETALLGFIILLVPGSQLLNRARCYLLSFFLFSWGRGGGGGGETFFFWFFFFFGGGGGGVGGRGTSFIFSRP